MHGFDLSSKEFPVDLVAEGIIKKLCIRICDTNGCSLPICDYASVRAFMHYAFCYVRIYSGKSAQTGHLENENNPSQPFVFYKTQKFQQFTNLGVKSFWRRVIRYLMIYRRISELHQCFSTLWATYLYQICETCVLLNSTLCTNIAQY